MTETLETPMPARIAALKRDSVGRPVPWFVAWLDGKPDFRIVERGRLERAIAERRCWICGTTMRGATAVFVIGPMCAVNRLSAEPPSHRECAWYAAQACPFLSNPNKVRREGNIPGDAELPAGEMIRRNPGVTALWVTLSTGYEVEPGPLWRLTRQPVRVLWLREGRAATRDEVVDSIVSGLPQLAELAVSPEAEDYLAGQVAAAMRLVPAA